MYQLFVFIAFRWSWDSGLCRPFWYYRAALKNWQYEGFIVLEQWITHGLVYYSWVTHECWDWLLTHANTHKPINLDHIFSCKSMHAYAWTYTKKFCICTPNPSFSFACITWGRSCLLLTSKASGKTMSAHQWAGWLAGSREVWILFSIFILTLCLTLGPLFVHLVYSDWWVSLTACYWMWVLKLMESQFQGRS